MSFRRMQPAVRKPGGGILEWFEAYADALNSGYYKVISSYRWQWSKSPKCLWRPRNIHLHHSMAVLGNRIGRYTGEVKIPSVSSFASSSQLYYRFSRYKCTHPAES